MNIKKHKTTRSATADLSKGVSLISLFGVLSLATKNPVLILTTSFVATVLLDPIVITLFSNSWKGAISVRVYNLALGMVAGTVVWVLVWIGTRFAEPSFYGPAWGLLYILSAVIIPAIANDGWKQVTPIMWAFLFVGLASLSIFILLTLKPNVG